MKLYKFQLWEIDSDRDNPSNVRDLGVFLSFGDLQITARQWYKGHGADRETHFRGRNESEKNWTHRKKRGFTVLRDSPVYDKASENPYVYWTGNLNWEGIWNEQKFLEWYFREPDWHTGGANHEEWGMYLGALVDGGVYGGGTWHNLYVKVIGK